MAAPEKGRRVDFFSDEFDALTALYAENIQLPCPNVKPFNNLAEYENVMQRRDAHFRKKESIRASAAGSSTNVMGIGSTDPTSINPLQRTREERELIFRRMMFKAARLKKGAKEALSDDESETGSIAELPAMMLKGKQKMRTKRNVLIRMEEYEQHRGPFSVLHRAVQERIRVKVWTRSAKQLRGFCKGYIVAFDKHWNLAMVDVDEVFSKPCLPRAPYPSCKIDYGELSKSTIQKKEKLGEKMAVAKTSEEDVDELASRLQRLKHELATLPREGELREDGSDSEVVSSLHVGSGKLVDDEIVPDPGGGGDFRSEVPSKVQGVRVVADVPEYGVDSGGSGDARIAVCKTFVERQVSRDPETCPMHVSVDASGGEVFDVCEMEVDGNEEIGPGEHVIVTTSSLLPTSEIRFCSEVTTISEPTTGSENMGMTKLKERDKGTEESRTGLLSLAGQIPGDILSDKDVGTAKIKRVKSAQKHMKKSLGKEKENISSEKKDIVLASSTHKNVLDTGGKQGNSEKPGGKSELGIFLGAESKTPSLSTWRIPKLSKKTTNSKEKEIKPSSATAENELLGTKSETEEKKTDQTLSSKKSSWKIPKLSKTKSMEKQELTCKTDFETESMVHVCSLDNPTVNTASVSKHQRPKVPLKKFQGVEATQNVPKATGSIDTPDTCSSAPVKKLEVEIISEQSHDSKKIEPGSTGSEEGKDSGFISKKLKEIREATVVEKPVKKAVVKSSESVDESKSRSQISGQKKKSQNVPLKQADPVREVLRTSGELSAVHYLKGRLHERHVNKLFLRGDNVAMVNLL